MLAVIRPYGIVVLIQISARHDHGGGRIRLLNYLSRSHLILLDLHREAFSSSCGDMKSLERIQSVLKSGKPVRN